jgi:hypothetical protein
MMAQEPTLPSITLDAVFVGQELGVLEHLFSIEDVVDYASEVADSSSWFHPHDNLSVRLHPAMLSTVSLRLLRLNFEASAVILAEQEETYFQSAWTGHRLTTRGKITGKGQRRGRDFVEIKTSTCDEDGRELVRRLTTLYLTVERSG